MKRIFSFLISLPIYFYRSAISPYLRPSCRHIPSCSEYAIEAIKIHGPLHGFIMGTNRILRCRPGGTHGFDPVPLFRFRRYRPFSVRLRYLPKGNRLKI
jgi:uncharacterized protein